MKWLTEHLTALGLLSLTFMIAALKWGGPLVKALRGFVAMGKTIDERKDHLIHVTETDRQFYERRCDELDIEVSKLREELIQDVRDKDILDEIRERDRLTIRLLKLKCSEKDIDYSDVEETVRKARINKH